MLEAKIESLKNILENVKGELEVQSKLMKTNDENKNLEFAALIDQIKKIESKRLKTNEENKTFNFSAMIEENKRKIADNQKDLWIAVVALGMTLVLLIIVLVIVMIKTITKTKTNEVENIKMHEQLKESASIDEQREDLGHVYDEIPRKQRYHTRF